MTGKPYSSFRTSQPKARPFDILKIGLRREREELYERINRRVDQMITDGSWTLETAVEKIKQNTRIYSRKQMTWFRRDESIHWFHPDETEAIKKLIEKEIMP
jgi:tRNA dimethylallyltransferase